jgi:hypothetical protein
VIVPPGAYIPKARFFNICARSRVLSLQEHPSEPFEPLEERWRSLSPSPALGGGDSEDGSSDSDGRTHDDR